MNIVLNIKRLWVWICRFPHRRGYGVHSPFAFQYITEVVYQRRREDIYKELRQQEQQQKASHPKEWATAEPARIKRMLFRMVRHAAPTSVFEVGPSSSASIYMKAPFQNRDYWHAEVAEDLPCVRWNADFVYIRDYRHPKQVEQAFRQCVAHATPSSVVVIYGIGYTSQMRYLWELMRCNQYVGVTIDAYDVGILFFDKKLTKQHYKIDL